MYGRYRRKVVVTGIGAFTPLGENAAETHEALLAGVSGIRRITSFDTAQFATKIAAEIDFDPHDHFNRREARHLDRLAQLGIIAAREALAGAGISSLEDEMRRRVSVRIGVGAVGFHTIEREIITLHARGPARVHPYAILMFQPDAVSGEICRRINAEGPNYTINSACASGSDAMVSACDDIFLHRADIVVTGGAGAEITPFGLSTFGQMEALSTRNDDPSRASCPFSSERDGFVLGEGAVMFVLEGLDSAIRRGVPILAEIIGCGQTTDTHHAAQPDPEGLEASRAMKMALEDAGISPRDVDLISAHGTSTPYNDRMETLAIRRAFGAEADRVLVNATKSMAGHLIGGAGPLGALAVIMAMRTRAVHPTINLTTPDKGCELRHVTGTLYDQEINVGMVNAFGFQGHNTALIFRRWTR